MSATPASRRRGQLSLRPALLRRGWVLPWTALVVAALAYGVATLQSTTYNAEAVLTVSPAIGTGPGSASQANELAGTYANAIPRDEGIERVLVREIGRSATADGTVDASLRRDSAVLDVTFTAPERDDAKKGAQAIAAAVSSTRPVTTSISPGTMRIVRRPGGTRAVPGGFQATFSALVPAGGGRGSVVSADQANKLAASYAGLISADDVVVAETARAIGLPEATVRSKLTLFHDQETSILRVRYQADSPEQASKGARTVAGLVAGDRPVTATVLPSSIEIVSLPRGEASKASDNSKAAIPIGALIGLALGLVLLVAWERSNPHITSPRDITAQIGCPATPVDRLSPEAANALLERWASLSGSVPARVAILPANEKAEPATDEAVQFLREAGGSEVAYEDRRHGHGHGHGAGDVDYPAVGDPDDPDVSVVLLHAGSPGGGAAGEAVALESDLTVIVIPKSMTAATVRSLTDGLSDYGVVPVWALMTTSLSAVERRRQEARALAN